MSRTKTSCGTIKFPEIPSDYSYAKAFAPMTWKGLSHFHANNLWTDGTNIYYSVGTEHYVLNGDTWVTKTWNGLTDFYAYGVWTDNTNIYYSKTGPVTQHYVLNGDTWEEKTWRGFTSFTGDYIWTDGTNIYYSNTHSHKVLNGDTWVDKNWSGSIIGVAFYPNNVWTDGTNIYYTYNNECYSLNGDTWEEVGSNATWLDGRYMWSDGKSIFSSRWGWDVLITHTTGGDNALHHGNLVLNGLMSVGDQQTSFNGNNVWTDGTNIYFSEYDEHYVMLPTTAKAYTKGSDGWYPLGEVRG